MGGNFGKILTVGLKGGWSHMFGQGEMCLIGAPWFSISNYLVAVFLLIDFVVSFLRWRWSSKAEEGSIRCVLQGWWR